MPEAKLLNACIGAIAFKLLLRQIGHRRPRVHGSKPQQKFKRVLASNTDSPFVHLSEDLASLQTQSDQQSHPLAKVISRLTAEDQSCLKRFDSQPRGIHEAKVLYVRTVEALQEAAQSLATAAVIGVDVEHNHMRSYRGIVCLLQLHADGANYVIDILELHDTLLDQLRPIFANPAIVKVVHGGDNDILWLQRELHIYIANLFDTEKAASVLGKKERSLQSLLLEYADVFQDKKHQLDDWRQRPLTEDMLNYAITDAHYLPFLASRLQTELLSQHRQGESSALETAFQRSQAVASELYHKTSAEEAAQGAFASIWKRQRSKAVGVSAQKTATDSFEGQQRRLAALCQWRDRVARINDEGVLYIMSNAALWDLASSNPQSESDAQIAVESSMAAHGPSSFFSSRQEQKAHYSELVKMLTAPPEVDNAFKRSLPARKPKGPGLSRAEKRLLVAKKFSAKRQVYENCRMLSQDGTLLCFCDMRKVRWYEAKGLGKRICNDPPTIQLTFEHKIGDQDLGQDAFYTASRDNHCVVCAGRDHLLRYRVVPACYRKNFPVHQKSHRSHDVVLLCFNCHEAAQKSAEQVKREIASSEFGPRITSDAAQTSKYRLKVQSLDSKQAMTCRDCRDTGVPLNRPLPSGPHSKDLPPPYQVRHAAVALRAAGERMPQARKEMLESLVQRYLEGTKAGLPDTGGSAQPAYPGSSLTLAMLDEALLAGLGPKRRKQSLRRMSERDAKLKECELKCLARSRRLEVPVGSPQGGQVCASGSDACGAQQEADEGSKETGATSEGEPGVRNSREDDLPERPGPQEAGHMWHGRQVVEKLMDRGGEEGVNAMIQRFRAAFVEATNPQHLPPFWQVDHNAVRQFGEYSVYKGAANK